MQAQQSDRRLPAGSCPVCGELAEAVDGETYRCPNGHESAMEDALELTDSTFMATP